MYTIEAAYIFSINLLAFFIGKLYFKMMLFINSILHIIS